MSKYIIGGVDQEEEGAVCLSLFSLCSEDHFAVTESISLTPCWCPSSNNLFTGSIVFWCDYEK